MNETRTERLEMRWLPVTVAGRTRMEAVWVAVPPAAPGQRPAVTRAA